MYYGASKEECLHAEMWSARYNNGGRFFNDKKSKNKFLQRFAGNLIVWKSNTPPVPRSVAMVYLHRVANSPMDKPNVIQTLRRCFHQQAVKVNIFALHRNFPNAVRWFRMVILP